MNAYFLSLNPKANALDQWDSGLLIGILNDLEATIHDVTTLPSEDKAIVVIPARHHAELSTQVNKQLAKIKHVILFLMGDEEADYPVEKISHTSIHIWVQNPHIGRHDDYNKLGTGYPKHMNDFIPETLPEKSLNVFFAGQVTHQRREELAEVLTAWKTGNFKDSNETTHLLYSEGFTQGESHQDYYEHMLSSKLAPCPSGAVIPDSFRLFEALECMTIPIADERTPDGTIMEYWDWLFDEATPFPHVTNWDRLFGLIPELIEDYPRNIHQITAWYIKYKRNFKLQLLEQYG
jgi:hypothetical protein